MIVGHAAARQLAAALRIAALAAAYVAAVIAPAAAATPGVLTPPAGNVRFLSTTGVGTQDYICLPTPANPAVTAFVFIRPESGLSVPVSGALSFEVAENILSAVPGQATTPSRGCVEAADGRRQYCPAWRSPHDLSAVWGSAVAIVPAGGSKDCPNTGAISCLLLKAVATRLGRIRPDLLGHVTYIQRLDTQGGAAPTSACTIGQIEQVPYRATYNFYRTKH